MEGIIVWLLLVASNLVSCQDHEASQSPDPIATSMQDPYANVLSQLSDVIFDVEERLYRLTAPKSESENLKASSDESKNNRKKNYFDHIRDNYKTLQDQFGQSLSSGGAIKMADILNLNFQNKGPRSSIDLSLPFLPLNIQIDAKKSPAKEIDVKNGKVAKNALKESPSDSRGNIRLGMKGISDKESSEDSKEFQKRSSRPTRSASVLNKKVNNKGKSSTEGFGDSSKSIHKNPLEWDGESEVEGRILGDLLFSESTFDKHFRRLLKDHGKWLFDSNIQPPKDIIESIRDVTRDQFSASKSTKIAHRGEKPEVMPNKNEQFNRHRHPEVSKHDAGSKIVLAFTPEGFPLKLKIDPRHNKPLKFLHRILSEERVSLNIPVNTMNGIQPVGSGVLHLGFEDSLTRSRTPLLDLSDNNQLNYLLRTLKKLRDEHY